MLFVFGLAGTYILQFFGMAAPALTKRIGQTGMNVMTRLMGLLVMVVGSQFVINGATTVVLDIVGRIRAA